MEIVRLERSRLDEASAALARAFFDDPAWVWLLPDPERRARLSAVALPDRLRHHRCRGLRDRRAGARRRALASAGSRADARRRDAACARHDAAAARLGDAAVPRVRPCGRGAAAEATAGPHWYLAGIGVEPAARRQGIGGALLAPGIAAAERDGVPAVLLTNNEENLSFYEAARLPHACARATRRRTARMPGLWSSGREPEPPKRYPDRDEIAAVRAEAETLEDGAEAAETRRLAGRVMARRDMGKLVFLDLVDRSGRIQLLCPAARTGEVDVHLGDVVGATGKPAKSRRGEPSLVVDELELLSRIRSPLPDTFHGLTDVEQRYRRRYLDLLMNEETRADFILRSRMVKAIRDYLDGDGFVEVETPALQADYGGAFARPFATHSNELDQDIYLRIAGGELYLKRLIVGGLEKVYEIGRVFRNEGVSYKHNPEFTMLEWYEAYADYRDTMERFETLVETVALEVLGTTKVTYRGHEIDLKRPWRRVKLVDALTEHGVWSEDETELRAILEARGIDTTEDKTWAQLVDHALTNYVEPKLIQPTFLHDYPVGSRRSRGRRTTTTGSSSGSRASSAGRSSATPSAS